MPYPSATPDSKMTDKKTELVVTKWLYRHHCQFTFEHISRPKNGEEQQQHQNDQYYEM